MLGKRPYGLWICILVLWVFCTSDGFAQSHVSSQIITFPRANATVLEYFEFVEERYRVLLSYSPNQVDLKRRVYIARRKGSIQELLEAVLEDQPLRLVPRATNRIVLVYIEEDHSVEAPSVDHHSVKGFVRSAETGEPLIDAHVWAAAGEYVASTNEYGFFSLRLPDTVRQIQTSYVGFEPATWAVDARTSDTYFLDLAPNVSIGVGVVVITDSVFHEKPEAFYFDNRLGVDQLANFPSQIGEEDPFRHIRMISGVQSGNEAQGGLYIRGGSPDQNLILLDGIPLYETSHILGVSSIFNTRAIKHMEVHKGSFPAKYGGRLSSVLNIHLKEGNSQALSGSAQMGLLGASAQLEGPIGTEKTTFNLAARHSWINLYLDPLLERFVDYDDTDIRYYDVNFKLSHRFSPGNKLFLSGYIGDDVVQLTNTESTIDGDAQFDILNESNLQWGSKIFGLKWNRILSNQMFATIQTSFSDYNFQSRGSFQFQLESADTSSTDALDVIALSNIRDLAASATIEYYPNEKSKLQFGFGIIDHNYNPTIKQSKLILSGAISDAILSDSTTQATEFFGFIEQRLQSSSWLELSAGVRFSGFHVDGGTYTNFQPRFRTSFFYKKHRLDLGYSKMAQYVHLLVNPGIGLPSDLWVPSRSFIPPETSAQFDIKYEAVLPAGFHASVELYSKKLENLIEYENSFDLFYKFLNEENVIPIFDEHRDWEDRIELGSGKSEGMEVSIENQGESHHILLSYALSKTDRQFENINNGAVFPYKYDRRHDITLAASLDISSDWQISASWNYGSGSAFTLAVDGISAPGGGGPVVVGTGARNNFRLPDYHRLDLQFRYQRSWKNRQLTANLGFYNAYNRHNPFYVYLYKNPIDETFQLRKVSLFPIIPHLSIGFSF